MLICLSKRVAVVPIEDPSISPGGLHIPDSAKQKCDQGIIKYRGPDTDDFRVGDHVLFSPYAGTKITLADEGQLIILPIETIEAKLDTEKEFGLLIPFSKLRELAALSDSIESLLTLCEALPYSEGFEF